MCVNFALGITTIADTPLSIPTTYERCYADFTESGQGGLDLIVQYDNSTGTYIPPSGSVGESIDDMIRTDPGNEGSMINAPGSSGTPGPFDELADSVEIGLSVLNTMKNFIAGGFITDVISHINLQCDTDPESPNFGQPVQTEVWSYFTGGIQVIFGFLLALTLFNWIAGRSTGLGS